MRRFKSYLLRQRFAVLRITCAFLKTVEHGVVCSVNKDLPVRGIAVCLEKWLISSDIGRSVYATHGKVALGLVPPSPSGHILLQEENVRHSRM